MATYEIPVPGSFRSGFAFLDIETEKVATPEGWAMPSGERLRRRWAVIFTGVGRDGRIVLVDSEGDEEAGLEEVGFELAGAESVVYGATRQFDEMVLRGRFTNARRALLPTPVWPAVPGGEDLNWVNIGTEKSSSPRGADILSRDVPSGYANGKWVEVAVHNLRDVADLILLAGSPDREAAAWLRRVLADFSFASETILSEPSPSSPR